MKVICHCNSYSVRFFYGKQATYTYKQVIPNAARACIILNESFARVNKVRARASKSLARALVERLWYEPLVQESYWSG